MTDTLTLCASGMKVGMNYCECPKCDFTWASKMGRHGTTEDPEYQGSYPVLCRICTARFVVPTRAPWGIWPKEVLELCMIDVLEWVEDEPWRPRYPKRSKLVRTGVSTVAVDCMRPLKDMADFSQLPCPACGAREAIRDRPEPGLCPVCVDAELVWGVIE